uniref:Tetraspanin n=1 Tax=Pundamilia nyererei TaxID=303518 RepID=A0A3B4FAH3_9CICH
AGIAFIAAGFWAWSEKGVLMDLTQVTRVHGFDPVWLVLAVGGITFVLGFAGCVGALRENICLLKFNACCGAQTPQDWNQNVYFSCDENNRSREKCGVPFSCCIQDPADLVMNTQCGYDVRRNQSEWSKHIYTKGCIAALEDWLPRNLYTVAIVFVVISLLQMVGIYLARNLIADIEKVKFSY